MMKVGDHLNKIELAKNTIIQAGGIAKTAEFIAIGLAGHEVATLCKQGYIERVRHGFYQLPAQYEASEEQLLAALLPEGIVCMESALFHYGYSDFVPRLWTVAVPRTISRTKLQIDALPLKPYYIQKEEYLLGKTTATFNDVTLAVYDRERTICDCFKFRAKLDSELFVKAVHAYVADSEKNLANFSKYAKEMRIYRKVSELMEVLLNG